MVRHILDQCPVFLSCFERKVIIRAHFRWICFQRFSFANKTFCLSPLQFNNLARCRENKTGHANSSSVNGCEPVPRVCGVWNGETLSGDTGTYLNTVLSGSLSKLNFRPSDSQSYSLKYDRHNDALLAMHNAFCVSWKRSTAKGPAASRLHSIHGPRRPFFLSASSLLANSRYVYWMSLLDSLHCMDYCSSSVLSPSRWPKQGRALSDAVTMTTSILSAPFWFRAPKTRFICKVWPSIIEPPPPPRTTISDGIVTVSVPLASL